MLAAYDVALTRHNVKVCIRGAYGASFLTLTDSTTPKLAPFSTSEPASGSSTYTMSPNSACMRQTCELHALLILRPHWIFMQSNALPLTEMALCHRQTKSHHICHNALCLGHLTGVS